MSDPQSMLDTLLGQELPLERLAERLVAETQGDPDATKALQAALDQAREEGRLSAEDTRLLQQRLHWRGTDATGTTAEIQEPMDDGETRVTGSEAAGADVAEPATPQPDGEEPEGATRVVPPAAPEEAEGTAVSTGPAPAPANPTPVGDSQASWSDLAELELTPEPPLEPGSVLKERFLIEETIGAGGMGTVFKAKDLRREEAQDRHPHVALKVLSGELKQHRDSIKILQREARKSQTLAHPNIITVYDFDRDGTRIFMSMELLEGEPLDHLIKKEHPHGLPLKQALPIVEGMGAALGYAHKKNIVHSDFKPGNVFVTRDGEIKVLDFGIARAKRRPDQAPGETTMFDPGQLGALTPAYASCEMLEQREEWEPDPRDDIYALACVTYELLCGKHPYHRMPANQARDNGVKPEPIKGLNRKQWQGLLRGLSLEHDARTPTVEQFVADLSGAAKRSSVPLAASAIVLVAALAGGGVFLYDWLHKSQIETLMDSLRHAVESDQLRPPADPNATALLRELENTAEGNDPRLQQARNLIAGQFLERAQQARSAGRVEQAEQSLARAGDYRPTKYLRKSIDQEQAYIADLRDALEVLRTRMEADPRFPADGETLGEAAEHVGRIQELAPEAPELQTFSERVRAMTERRIAALADARRWTAGNELLDEVSDYLEVGFVERQRDHLAQAREAHQARVDRLVASVEGALAKGRLEPPAEPNAKTLLASLQKLAPGDDRVDALRNRYQTLLRDRRPADRPGESDEPASDGTSPDRPPSSTPDRPREQLPEGSANELLAALEKRVAQRTFTPAWEREVRRYYDAAKRKVSPNDPRMQNLRRKLADYYAIEAQRAAAQRNFARAEQLLERGEYFYPGWPRLRGVRNAIQAARGF